MNIESAIAACRSIAIENGYGLRLSTKKTNRQGVITSRQLLCDRAGLHDSQSKGIRKSGTMKCNCKFSLWIRLSGDEYIIDVSSPNHNHPPSISATGHPCVTSLKENEKENVIRKSDLGIPPRTILAELRQDDSHATAKGIYNCLATHRKLQLGGQTPICALLRLLRGEAYDYFKVEHQEWWFDYSIDTESCLTHLFFLHKTSLNLLRKFPEVIIMDCTYSTNRFKMPLLHMVGCTNINSTFEAGYVFLSQETEGDYQWALDTFKKVLQENSIQELGVIVTDRELALMNAIDQKFPSSKNILCAWHIKMALQTHLGKELDTDSVKDFIEDFMKVWNAPTSVEFSENWSSCKAKWLATNNNGGRIVKYMEDTWLPYAERFVICFVNRYLHLGNLTSGKAEGAHC